MAGENKPTGVQKVELDSIVDVLLPGLGLVSLTLLGNQFFLLMRHFVPATAVLWLTAIGALAGLVGLVARKMRRGQHNLPQMIRVVEVGFLAVITFLLGFASSWLLYAIQLALVLVIYHLAYQMAHWSEELLFDFDRLEKKGGWQAGWSGREGLRLYSRHTVGYKGLIQLMMTGNVLLVLVWAIGRQMQFWTLLGGGVFFFFQAVFLGVAFYQKQQIRWVIQGYQIQPGIVKRMVGLLLIVSMLVTSLGLILPVHYNPIPWRAIGDLINGLLGSEEFEMQAPGVTEQQPEMVRSDRKSEQPMLEVLEPSWHMTLFIILFACLVVGMIAIVAGFFISLINEEAFRLKGFGGLLVRMYLFFKGMIQAWIQGLRRGTQGMTSKWQEARQRREQERLERLLDGEGGEGLGRWKPNSPREEIVYLFADLIEFLTARGLGKEEHQTLTEYVNLVIKQLPDLRNRLGEMQGLLEQAVYSRHEIDTEQVRRMAELARLLKEQV